MREGGRGGGQDGESSYRLAGGGREAAEGDRLNLLEQIFDPLSRQRRGMVQPGWRCLEVGAGRGSMAVWLAGQVGPAGRVVATDIDVTYLRRLDVPNLEVVEHDIIEDPADALGAGSFDLVCSRLMLFHLTGRQEAAIRQMARCLRPGGWLIDEDADWGTTVLVDPAHPRYASFHQAWRDGDWWASRGYDPAFGRKLPCLIERCGLVGVQADARTELVRGGSAWARWYAESLNVIHQAAGSAGTGVQRREHEQIVAALADSSAWLMRELLHCCRGRRPPRSRTRPPAD
jgi:ubiquinone/menaquinone biosynthesis C-methylase UbiE